MLQDGASSIYGSDAIAGVINIITKKEFEGIEFSGYAGEWTRATEKRAVQHLGRERTDRSSAFLKLSYTNQEGELGGPRDLEFPTPGLGFCTNRCSSGTPQGRFLFPDPSNGAILMATDPST